MNTAIDTTEIKYDRASREYVVTDDGREVAWAANYHEAEQKRTAYLRERDEAHNAR